MSERFAQQDIVFTNGSVGTTITFDSANPVNYADIVQQKDFPRIEIDGKLFLPPEPSASPPPVVIVVPGSVGVADSHIMHAETLTDIGHAAFLIDPFGARSVTSTVANQTQFSFAASAYDVLAAVKALAKLPEVDRARIGAQGHSRGGSAVLSAAMRPFQKHVLLPEENLRAIYSVYPWCGHQLLNPDMGDTHARIVIGDIDNWCSSQQAQGYAQAIRLTGGGISFRMFENAHHSFDRKHPIEEEPGAKVAPHAPIIYLDDAGAMIHPITGEADPSATDYDFMVFAMKAGFGVTGASLGSVGNQADMFKDDMTRFWKNAL